MKFHYTASLAALVLAGVVAAAAGVARSTSTVPISTRRA